MWNQKKVGFLFIVFLLTGLAVWLTRLANDNQLLAKVLVVPHDGKLLNQGQNNLAERLVTENFQAVFYEEDTKPYLMPFSGPLDSSVLSALQQKNNLVWHSITPDTLFLRAFSKSYADMLQKLSTATTDSLNEQWENSGRLRRLAVLSRGAKRDSILAVLHGPLDQWTNGQSEKLRKRYANQLLGKLSQTVLTQPGQKWMLLIDIEHYPYVKSKLKGAPRFEWLD